MLGTPADPLLAEFFPVKLIGAFIAVDFVSGCSFGCRFCISRRHPAREALFAAGRVVDNGATPDQVFRWLRSMPSYRAGVQIRIGHDTDAGLEFGKSAALIERIDPDRSVVYLTRKPLGGDERAFFGTYRKNLLLKPTATPRSFSLGVRRDPLALVRSLSAVDPRMLHWVVGPLAAGSEGDAERILRALPRGSRLTLKPVSTAGLPALQAVAPMAAGELARLTALALGLGHDVTEFFCRGGLARVGRGFFDVDKLTGDPDERGRARALAGCSGCDSREQCHAELELAAMRARLDAELRFLGLTLTAEPVRRGPRSFSLSVAEPSSRGEETYLDHSVGAPVSFTLSTREPGGSEGGSFCRVSPEVLARWQANGFLPVDELAEAARRTLAGLRRTGALDGARC